MGMMEEMAYTRRRGGGKLKKSGFFAAITKSRKNLIEE